MFKLSFRATTIIPNQYGFNDEEEIESEIFVDAPIENYGRVAKFAKDKRLILKHLKEKNKKIKGFTTIKPLKTELYCLATEVEDYLNAKIYKNKIWFEKLDKPQPEDRMKFQNTNESIKKEKEFLEKIYKGEFKTTKAKKEDQ